MNKLEKEIKVRELDERIQFLEKRREALLRETETPRGITADTDRTFRVIDSDGDELEFTIMGVDSIHIRDSSCSYWVKVTPEQLRWLADKAEGNI